MKYIKVILWAILLVSYDMLCTEEYLWGPDQDIRAAMVKIHFGTMPLLYLFYLIQGILRKWGDRLDLIRFLIVYHIRNVPLFVIGWIVVTFLIVWVGTDMERMARAHSA